MRTAFITNFCPFYRRKLYTILTEKIGARFCFFSDASESNWEQKNPHGDDSLPCVPVRTGNESMLRVLLRLAHHLLTNRYDCYIQGISGRWVVPLTWFIARMRGTPYVAWTGFWNHPNTFFHRVTFPLVRHIYRNADAVIAYGTHVKDYLLKLGVHEEKIFIGWNTADNEAYAHNVLPEQKEELRKELDAENTPLILFVGRLQKEKGCDVLLHALRMCRDRGVNPVACIIGTGNEKNILKRYCAENNLSHVIFRDYVPNDQLYIYYNAADVLVVPSVTTHIFKEPWGLIINEAMNQGCPVIASDAVGAAQGGLVRNGETGLIVPENNPEELAVAMEQLLLNEELRGKMRKNAREIIKEWTYPRMAKGFIDAVEYAVHMSGRGN